MKTFNVILSRAYKVKIEAEDENSAMENAEFFIGNPKDESNEKHRKEYKFEIQEIEMTVNEAIEAEETED